MGQKLAKEGTLQQGLSIVCNSLYHAVLSAVTSNANIPRGAIWQKVKTRPPLVGSFFFLQQDKTGQFNYKFRKF